MKDRIEFFGWVLNGIWEGGFRCSQVPYAIG
jgi:hypothetical protein